ncbi:SUF system Fe-S cluster assembly regulator [Acidocella sp.]|uniref:SUF system Fe-S cluster assembly regulator n=1 Tax=Acidocella sp. TaxID=50710 RepID=UPI002603C666|nr:SUF system Fe-S cluster assembly regulator [Acidocella sp.]
MLKLSRLTDYAVAALVRLSAAEGVETSPGIAAAIGVPEPTVAKVLKLLAGSALVSSTRGARGGYRLARPLSEIAVSEIIVAIDGPIALTSCVDGTPGSCDSQPLCPVAGRWGPVNDAIRSALDNISLADMAVAALPQGLRLTEAEMNHNV